MSGTVLVVGCALAIACAAWCAILAWRSRREMAAGWPIALTAVGLAMAALPILFTPTVSYHPDFSPLSG